MINEQGREWLKATLRAQADHYDQNTFGVFDRAGILASECGTMQCMAGFCLLKEIGSEEFISWIKSNYSDLHDPIAAGCRILGIEPWAVTPQIFGTLKSWPLDLQQKYMAVGTSAGRAEVACEALDRMTSYGDIMEPENAA